MDEVRVVGEVCVFSPVLIRLSRWILKKNSVTQQDMLLPQVR